MVLLKALFGALTPNRQSPCALADVWQMCTYYMVTRLRGDHIHMRAHVNFAVDKPAAPLPASADSASAQGDAAGGTGAKGKRQLSPLHTPDGVADNLHSRLSGHMPSLSLENTGVLCAGLAQMSMLKRHGSYSLVFSAGGQDTERSFLFINRAPCQRDHKPPT